MLQHTKELLHLLSPRAEHLWLHAFPDDKRKFRSPAAGSTKEAGYLWHYFYAVPDEFTLKMYARPEQSI